MAKRFAEIQFVNVSAKLSTYQSNVVDAEQHHNVIGADSTPSAVRASSLAAVRKIEKENDEIAEYLRSVLALAIRNMEPENIVAFMMLEGVAEDVVRSANFTRGEQKEKAVKSRINAATTLVAEVLAAKEVLPEVAAEIIAATERKIRQASK